MSSKLTRVIIVLLLLAAVCEGFAISQLYTSNVNYSTEMSALQAQLSGPRGSLYPMTVVDDLNRTVTITHEPQRIVSLEPSDTQIVFTIGQGEKVVGATSWDHWPTLLTNSIASDEVATVGGVLSSSISVETVIGLNPDLVLAGSLNEEGQIIQQLTSAGIPVLVLAPQTMGMIYNDVLLVGKVVNAYKNATSVVNDMRIVVNYVSAKVKDAQRLSVFYEVWNNPLMTAAPTSFIGQLITLAGGSNLFSNATGQYPTVNPEAVVSLNPQIIITTNEFNMTAEQVAKQPGFQITDAAQAKRVFVLSDPDLIQQPSPRLVEGLLFLAKLIHPDLFNNTTITILNDFNGQFNDTSLSQFS